MNFLKSLSLILSCSVIFHYGLISQSLEVNTRGDSILKYADGSWRYFEENDRSLFAPKVLGPMDRKNARKAKRKNKSNKDSISDSLPKKEKQRFELVLTANVIKKLQKLSYDKLDFDQFNDVLAKINRYYADQVSALEEAQAEKVKIEQTLKTLEGEQQGLEKGSESYENVLDQITSIRKEHKANAKQIKILQKKVNKAEQLTRASEDYKSKWITKYEKKNGPLPLGSIVEVTQPKEELKKDPKKSGNADKPANIASKHRYSPIPAFDLEYDQYDCNIAFIGTDDFSNKRRIDVGKETLFEYTHDELKPYYKDKIYMTCSGYLSAQPGFKYLTLEFKIASDRAKQSFGTLQKGSILTLKLIDDTFINLLSTTDDYGTTDLQNKTTTYIGQYVINKKQEKELIQKELDQIRVMWTSGYEDYEIYEMDFLRNQFKCLNSAY